MRKKPTKKQLEQALARLKNLRHEENKKAKRDPNGSKRRKQNEIAALNKSQREAPIQFVRAEDYV